MTATTGSHNSTLSSLLSEDLTPKPTYNDVEGHPSPIERVVILDYILTVALKNDDRMALFARQLHYLSTIGGGEQRGGWHWVYKTFDEWLEHLPWGNRRAVEHVVLKLRDTGTLIVQKRLSGGMRYRLDYRKLQGLCLLKTGLSPTWLDTAVRELPDRDDFQPQLAPPPPLEFPIVSSVVNGKSAGLIMESQQRRECSIDYTKTTSETTVRGCAESPQRDSATAPLTLKAKTETLDEAEVVGAAVAEAVSAYADTLTTAQAKVKGLEAEVADLTTAPIEDEPITFVEELISAYNDTYFSDMLDFSDKAWRGVRLWTATYEDTHGHAVDTSWADDLIDRNGGARDPIALLCSNARKLLSDRDDLDSPYQRAEHETKKVVQGVGSREETPPPGPAATLWRNMRSGNAGQFMRELHVSTNEKFSLSLPPDSEPWLPIWEAIEEAAIKADVATLRPHHAEGLVMMLEPAPGECPLVCLEAALKECIARGNYFTALPSTVALPEDADLGWE